MRWLVLYMEDPSSRKRLSPPVPPWTNRPDISSVPEATPGRSCSVLMRSGVLNTAKPVFRSSALRRVRPVCVRITVLRRSADTRAAVSVSCSSCA